MKTTSSLLLIVFACGFARAGDLPISAKEPLVVAAPDQWQSTKVKPPAKAFAFETYRIAPPTDRNVVCLVSIFGKDKPEFADAQYLKKLLREGSRTYAGSAEELSKIELKEMKI